MRICSFFHLTLLLHLSCSSVFCFHEGSEELTAYQVAIVENVQFAVQEIAEEAKRRQDGGNKGVMVDFDLANYHPYAEIMQYLMNLEDNYDFVTTEIIGYSFEGRELMVLKICSGFCGDKPIMWIDGGIHSREWISPATALFTIDILVQALPEGDEDLLEFDWYFLPVVNPDGYVYSWEKDRNWRKTRHVILENVCIGVDANRNFGYQWGAFGNPEPSCNLAYHGPEPWSEPEVIAVRDYLLSLGGDVVFFATLHSHGQQVMYPWGHTFNLTDDAEDQDRLGNEALRRMHGVTYKVGPLSSTVYPASGISIDWAYGEAGVKYSYTIELRDTGQYGFLLPPDQIVPTGEEIYAFHRAVMRGIREELNT